MSVLLYVVGALAVLAGVASIGFGVPVKEFSFGDTLIVAGTVALVGGFILIALAAAVAQLARIAEMLGARPLARNGRPLEALGPARVPFPPKPKAEPARDTVTELPPFVPAPIEPVQFEEPRPAPEPAAPSLRNPDVPLVAETEAEEAPLSPLKPPPITPRPSSPPPRSAFKFPEPPRPAPPPRADEPRPPPFEPPWRSSSRPSQPNYFDALRRKEPEPPAEPPRSPIMPEPEPEPEPQLELEDEQPPAEEARAVAILKSGVVDGMGYTLYVDGSIEAELPDGTLRFASITELRAHLERNA
jgi:hypothetical protein